MNNTDFTKQILDWNKTLFDSTVNFFEKYQEFGDNSAKSFVELSPWGAEEGKKLLNQWSANRKKGFKAFRDGAAFGFKQVEGLCAVAKPAK
jgi:hypothetical protein